MPGMIIPVAGGAAMGTAATSAAISGGLNVAQEAGPESMTAAAKCATKQIAKRLAEASERYGWLSTQQPTGHQVSRRSFMAIVRNPHK